MKDITGAEVAKALIFVARRVEEAKDYLCELDGEVGDGDHGVSMTIGMRAVSRVVQELPESATPAEAFQAAADAYADEVGATIGPLYETAFAAAGRAAGTKNTMNDVADWALVYDAMVNAIQQLGQAQRGDKTILDSFFPAVDFIKTLSGSREELASALNQTAKVAMDSAIATKDLVAIRGRASRLGERALGHQDAGATSLAIVLKGFADAIALV